MICGGSHSKPQGVGEGRVPLLSSLLARSGHRLLSYNSEAIWMSSSTRFVSWLGLGLLSLAPSPGTSSADTITTWLVRGAMPKRDLSTAACPDCRRSARPSSRALLRPLGRLGL